MTWKSTDLLATIPAGTLMCFAQEKAPKGWKLLKRYKRGDIVSGFKAARKGIICKYKGYSIAQEAPE